jgi:hypothetical protein
MAVMVPGLRLCRPLPPGRFLIIGDSVSPMAIMPLIGLGKLGGGGGGINHWPQLETNPPPLKLQRRPTTKNVNFV